jgi:hypothetical protein
MLDDGQYANLTPMPRQALTLEAEVGEERDVLGALLTLGQFRKHKEPLPPSALAESDTLEFHSQIIEIGFGDASAPHDPVGPQVLVGEVDEGENDAYGEYPLRNVERDELGRLDLGGPLIEHEKLNGSEGIDAVDG